MTQARRLAVTFVGDEDVVDHIVEKQQEAKAAGAAQTLVTLKASRKAKASEEEEEEDEEELCEQDYAEALFTGAGDEGDGGGGVSSGSSVFSFQTVKRGNKMAEMASEWVKTPGKTVTFSTSDASEETTSPTHSSRRSASQSKTPQKGKKAQFVSTTPHRLRRRLTAPSLRSDSESDLSPSGSEEDECEEVQQKHKTPSKRRRAPEPDLVEEYFQAHSSSKVLTSDRTLQKLQTPRLDRETLIKLLGNNRPSFSQEIQQLNIKHEQNFRRWMLQLHLGYNILLYGLGSKKRLLEKFRVSMLSGFTQVVVNGFFPSVTLRAILTCISAEVLEHHGTFRSPAEQLDFILKSLREDGSNHVFLIINNIDGHMLRGERVQQALAQLASLPTVHVLASVDHINAPLVWDQVRSGSFNWLWYESTSFLPYSEETSYENSLLVQHTGSLALSSLTHVLHSLTPNARGIFRLLAEYQLENKDNPAYSGLCFQDLYQRCRESFLVNSDITLRTQLTEFRDHKLIRQKKGADGVEYLTIPVDNTTLSDFLEKKDLD